MQNVPNNLYAVTLRRFQHSLRRSEIVPARAGLNQVPSQTLPSGKNADIPKPDKVLVGP
jgi:hypothetical protein